MKNHDSKNTFSGIRPGFTLTELLVVILIIVVIASLSLVGMKRMRAMADKAGSIRNLSQLQIANIAYATDHNGNCVPIRVNDANGNATRWFAQPDYLAGLMGEVLDKTGKQSLVVPLEMMDSKVVRARKPLHDRIYCSYGMNDTGLQLGGKPDLNSRHNLSQVSEPSRSMAFATATDFRITYNSRYKWNFENPKDEKTASGDIAYRHGNKVLVVYFDGHVGEMSKGDLEAIDKRGGRNNAFWRPKQ